MTTWTSDELDRIASSDELEMAPLRRDGTRRTPVPIWVVGDGDALYIRSGGVRKDVKLVEVADPEVNDRVDTAYRTKYGRFGDSYVNPLIAAQSTTLRLVPR